MSIDTIEQVRRYGEFLRSEIEAAGPSQTRVFSVDENATQSDETWSRGRVQWLVAAGLLACVAAGGLLLAKPESDEIVATPIESGAIVERHNDDTEIFLDRLAEVDFEMIGVGPRPATEVESAAVVNFFGQRSDGVVEDSVTVAQEYAAGPVAVEFDLVAPTPPTYGHCRAVGSRDGESIKFDGQFSCWDAQTLQSIPDDSSPQFSYGCRPVWGIPGGLAGKTGFVAEVFLPPGSPGVIFTVEDGEDSVLIRPTQDVVIYSGPVAKQMEIFYANGETHVIRTSDCM